MTVLPSLPLIFAALLLLRLRAHGGRNWRLSLFETAVLGASALIAVTELFGSFHLLHAGWISLGWLVGAALAVGVLGSGLRRSPPFLHHLMRRLRLLCGPPTMETWMILFVLVATGFIAWHAPAANYDSMTYQFPRVMHWLQQGSTEHYPTSNIRQLTYGPAAAYWQLHLWVLFGGDRGANLLQWSALVGSVLALGVWVRRFFPGRAATGLPLLVGATLPMAVLQASSTQTDLQVGCWLLIAAVFLTEPAMTACRRYSFAGLAVGLAILTKPSAVLCAAPLVLTALWLELRTQGVVHKARCFLFFTLCSGAICFPHFARNLRAFGSPLGNDGGTLVTQLSPALATANILRWATLNLPSTTVWQATAAGIKALGVSPNEPSITFGDLPYAPASPFIVQRLWLPDEDFVSYTLSLLVLGGIWLAQRLLPDRTTTLRSRLAIAPWLTALGVALLLHVTTLKWQCWGNRLLLPLALLALPLLAALGGTWRRPILRKTAASLLLIHTVFLLIFSLNRPFVRLPTAWHFTGSIPPMLSSSRNERFYAGYNSEALPIARQLVARVQSGEWLIVGLAVDSNYPEYVLWHALHEAGLTRFELRHLNPVPMRHSPPIPTSVDGYISSMAATPVSPH